MFERFLQGADERAMDFSTFLRGASVGAVIFSIVSVVVVVAAWVTFFQMGADLRRTRLELGAIREILRDDSEERRPRSQQ